MIKRALKSWLYIVAIIAATAFACLFAASGIVWTATELNAPRPVPPVRFASVSDTPLLTPEQREQAITTGKVAFTCAGMHYVIECGAAEMLGLVDG